MLVCIQTYYIKLFKIYSLISLDIPIYTHEIIITIKVVNILSPLNFFSCFFCFWFCFSCVKTLNVRCAFFNFLSARYGTVYYRHYAIQQMNKRYLSCLTVILYPLNNFLFPPSTSP